MWEEEEKKKQAAKSKGKGDLSKRKSIVDEDVVMENEDADEKRKPQKKHRDMFNKKPNPYDDYGDEYDEEDEYGEEDEDYG